MELESSYRELKKKTEGQQREFQDISKKASTANFDVAKSKEHERKMETKINDLTSKLAVVEMNHKSIVAELEQKS